MLMCLSQNLTYHWMFLLHADDIYRDDVVFKDPRNTLRGKKNYKRIVKASRNSACLRAKRLFPGSGLSPASFT